MKVDIFIEIGNKKMTNKSGILRKEELEKELIEKIKGGEVKL